MARLFYTRPMHLKYADINKGSRHYYYRALSVLMLYLGYQLGCYESQEENN